MLRLNTVQKILHVEFATHSNTTNVKVKPSMAGALLEVKNNSNTTNVKVKLGTMPKMKICYKDSNTTNVKVKRNKNGMHIMM